MLISCNGVVDDSVETINVSQSDQNSENNKKLFEERSGVVIPPLSNVIFFEEVRGSDLFLRAKVTMSKADFLDWIEGFGRELNDFSDELNFALSLDPAIWNAPVENGVKTIEISSENGYTFLHLGFVKKTEQDVFV